MSIAVSLQSRDQYLGVRQPTCTCEYRGALTSPTYLPSHLCPFGHPVLRHLRRPCATPTKGLGYWRLCTGELAAAWGLWQYFAVVAVLVVPELSYRLGVMMAGLDW